MAKSIKKGMKSNSVLVWSADTQKQDNVFGWEKLLYMIKKDLLFESFGGPEKGRLGRL